MIVMNQNDKMPLDHKDDRSGIIYPFGFKGFGVQHAQCLIVISWWFCVSTTLKVSLQKPLRRWFPQVESSNFVFQLGDLQITQIYVLMISYSYCIHTLLKRSVDPGFHHTFFVSTESIPKSVCYGYMNQAVLQVAAISLLAICNAVKHIGPVAQ